MKNIITFLVLLLGSLIVTSCNKEDALKLSDGDYLIFGIFYGECIGENCVRVFRLENNRLFEDIKHEYPGRTDFYNGNYIKLDQEKFELAKDLTDYFPNNLLSEKDTVFGCPDCVDQGGLYIEYKFNGQHKFWLIDQAKESVPIYLHEFMDKVNEKIDLLAKKKCGTTK